MVVHSQCCCGVQTPQELCSMSSCRRSSCEPFECGPCPVSYLRLFSKARTLIAWMQALSSSSPLAEHGLYPALTIRDPLATSAPLSTINTPPFVPACVFMHTFLVIRPTTFHPIVHPPLSPYHNKSTYTSTLIHKKEALRTRTWCS